MFHIAKLAALLAATASTITSNGEVLHLGEETGEIMVWSDVPKGFNDFTELHGNLDSLECLMSDTYFHSCKEGFVREIRKGSDIEDAIVVSYFIDEVYTHDELFDFKESYGTTDYNYVEVLGLSLEQGSQFYHRLNSILKQKRYRLYPTDYNNFKDKFRYNTQLVMFEVDTVSNALTLSHQVSDHIKSNQPEKTLISVIAPAKAELDEYSIQRRLQAVSYNYSRCENTASGNYCLDYYCNRSNWDTEAYSDSCIDSYDLLKIVLLILLFIPACCVGCCCLDGIQTPLRFPSRVLPVGKEF